MTAPGAPLLQVWWSHAGSKDWNGKDVPDLAAAVELATNLLACDVSCTVNVLDPTSGEWTAFDPSEPAELDELRALLGQVATA